MNCGYQPKQNDTIKTKSTLDAVLEDYADLGFSLKEEVAITGTFHLLELWFKDTRIARFNQLELMKETIWQACQEYLDKLNGKGVPFEE